jgi:hypothetical protein
MAKVTIIKAAEKCGMSRANIFNLVKDQAIGDYGSADRKIVETEEIMEYKELAKNLHFRERHQLKLRMAKARTGGKKVEETKPFGPFITSEDLSEKAGITSKELSTLLKHKHLVEADTFANSGEKIFFESQVDEVLEIMPKIRGEMTLTDACLQLGIASYEFEKTGISKILRTGLSRDKKRMSNLTFVSTRKVEEYLEKATKPESKSTQAQIEEVSIKETSTVSVDDIPQFSELWAVEFQGRDRQKTLITVASSEEKAASLQEDLQMISGKLFKGQTKVWKAKQFLEYLDHEFSGISRENRFVIRENYNILCTEGICICYRTTLI